MSQITLRKIPSNIEQQIRLISKKNRSSLNQTIIELLEKALGTEGESRKKRDLSKNFDTWNEAEVSQFNDAMKPFEKIDDEVWSQ